MMPSAFEITVPASTANLGPGFDTLGAALSLTLSVTVHFDPIMEITYNGNASVPTTVGENLITRTALYVAASCGCTLPNMKIAIRNPIPLGRGLGSSGAATVAGVLLADRACGLGLSQSQILDYTVLIEGHPDNVSASLLGGITASYCTRSLTKEHALLEHGNLDLVPGNDQLPKTYREDPLTVFVKIPVAKSVRAVVVIPRFTLATSLARSVLPQSYSREDVVYNLQRIAVLSVALGNPSPEIVSAAMSDKIHQEYVYKRIYD